MDFRPNFVTFFQISDFCYAKIFSQKVPGPVTLELTAMIVWERSNQPYFYDDLMNKNSTKPTDCCVKIYKSEDNSSILKSFIDCNEKVRTFICEFSITDEEVQTRENNFIDQPYCTHCNFLDWNNSICQNQLTDYFNLDLDDWQTTLASCRCSNNKLSYGQDCLNENCSYIFNSTLIENIYNDVASRSISETEVDKFKNEMRIVHYETYDLESIKDPGGPSSIAHFLTRGAIITGDGMCGMALPIGVYGGFS